MGNFIFQVIASLFIGGCFIYLAKRYNKSQVFYFCLGFFASLAIRFVYLLIYGFSTNFSVQEDFSYNRNLSVLLSIIIPYGLFILLRKKLEKKYNSDTDIDEIGK